MRTLLLFFGILLSVSSFGQQTKDTLYKRCPLYITDTVSANNFFIESLPATVRVFRDRGDLTLVIQQRDQFLSIFFRDKKLKNNTKYKIHVGADGKHEAEAKYSFKSGDQVSYVNVSSGTIETSYDKEKALWHLKINAMIANMVERSITYYRVKSDLYIR
jgi:hypothetical protein